MVSDCSYPDKDGDRQPCGDRPEIVKPLADGKADEIQKRAERES
jgi:hypothetical protein